MSVEVFGRPVDLGLSYELTQERRLGFDLDRIRQRGRDTREHELKLDALVAKGFNEKATPASPQEVKQILGDFRALDQLSDYKLCPTRVCHHQRAILYALLVFIVQRRNAKKGK